MKAFWLWINAWLSSHSWIHRRAKSRTPSLRSLWLKSSRFTNNSKTKTNNPFNHKSNNHSQSSHKSSPHSRRSTRSSTDKHNSFLWSGQAWPPTNKSINLLCYYRKPSRTSRSSLCTPPTSATSRLLRMVSVNSRMLRVSTTLSSTNYLVSLCSSWDSSRASTRINSCSTCWMPSWLCWVSTMKPLNLNSINVPFRNYSSMCCGRSTAPHMSSVNSRRLGS